MVSLKKSWLKGLAHQPVTLQGAEIYSVSQLQGYFRQLVTGRGRMVPLVGPCLDCRKFGSNPKRRLGEH